MYNLVGAIAEEKELTGNESLPELLGTFTEGRAVLTLEEPCLPDIGNAIRRNVKRKQRSMIRVARDILTDAPLKSEAQDRESALKALVSDYICSEFELKYNRLSPQLFKLIREVPVKVDEYNRATQRDIIIPLFASVDFGEEEWNLRDSLESDDYKHDIDISSKAPPISRHAKRKAKEAVSDYMGIVSKGLRDSVIGDLILRDLGFCLNGLDLRMYWIPSLSELDIKVETIDKDPFLVARVHNRGDRNYLVSQWDVKGEEPYQHYLAEFGIKNLS